MYAIVLHTFGPADHLRYEIVPDPLPGAGQVRIAVRAAGVHLVETFMRSGALVDKSPPLPELPTIFGGEVAGVVDDVGEGVDPSWIGRDVVVARSKPGGYAELSVADVTSVRPIPEGLGYEAAVTMVITGNTALGLLHLAELTKNDVVLVNSAAGGIGRLAVQYARNLGAKVIGAAGGPAKVAAVRELGADLAVDYNEPAWDKTVAEYLGGRKITVVLDGVGGAKARAAFDLLADGGRYVTIGTASQEAFVPDTATSDERGIKIVDALMILIQGRGELNFEAEALAAAAEGRLVPAFQTFPLADAAAAHAALEARATTGKVLLIP